MAVVAKHGVWDNATYPYSDTTANGFLGSICAEMDAWITAISANPSITTNGMLPVKIHGPSSSTNSGTNNGFVYQFPDTSIGLNKDGPSYPHFMHYGIETSRNIWVTDEYLDDGSNFGFGARNSNPGHFSGATCTGDTGFNNEVVVATETTDGEEFFACGVLAGNGTNDSHSFTIFKDTDNHWCFAIREAGFAYDTIQGYWTGTTGPYDTDPSSVIPASSSAFLPFLVQCANVAGAINRPGFTGEGQGTWIPKSSKIYCGRSTSGRFADYVTLQNGTETLLCLAYYGTSIIIPV